MSNNAFIKSLVNDYVSLGLCEKETDTSVKSFEGTLVEFEPIVNNKDTAGLNVFIDGDQLESILYEDNDFNHKLLQTLSGPLNF